MNQDVTAVKMGHATVVKVAHVLEKLAHVVKQAPALVVLIVIALDIQDTVLMEPVLHVACQDMTL